jgi:murein DD-endopeptidase MepM/ murein hydrolase activator NlpD
MTPTLPSTEKISPSLTETLTDSSTPWDTFTDTSTSSSTSNLRVYVFPVQPARDATFSDGGHPYPATDIFAPEGDRFVAVTDGVVDFVSFEDHWDPVKKDMSVAGGLCVAIIGDDGVRYYGSHLSAIAAEIWAGVRVKAGQLLGLVGHTGNAITTPFHVHFGISRPTYPGDWKRRRGEVDPYLYLIEWKKGVSITPVLSNLPPLP